MVLASGGQHGVRERARRPAQHWGRQTTSVVPHAYERKLRSVGLRAPSHAQQARGSGGRAATQIEGWGMQIIGERCMIKLYAEAIGGSVTGARLSSARKMPAQERVAELKGEDKA